MFIVDEVHMLSPAAFNAFLKTLEEPPSYVIFILATTEKHKIIPHHTLALPDLRFQAYNRARHDRPSLICGLERGA